MQGFDFLAETLVLGREPLLDGFGGLWRVSIFWSWMIASAGSFAGMPVYGLGRVSRALSQAL